MNKVTKTHVDLALAFVGGDLREIYGELSDLEMLMDLSSDEFLPSLRYAKLLSGRINRHLTKLIRECEECGMALNVEIL